MRIEQIRPNLTRIEVSRQDMNLVDELLTNPSTRITFIKEFEHFYAFTFQGSFSETVHVLELINKIHIYNYELDRLLNK